MASILASVGRAIGWLTIVAMYGGLAYGVYYFADAVADRHFDGAKTARTLIALGVVGAWHVHRAWMLKGLRRALVKDTIEGIHDQMESEPEEFSNDPVEGLDQYVELLRELRYGNIKDFDVGNSVMWSVASAAWACFDLFLTFSPRRKRELIRRVRASVFADMRLTFGANPDKYGPTLQQAVRKYAFEHKITK
jgi:hypothetical protein